MSKVQVGSGYQHASIRVYIFGCTYLNFTWQDSPNTLFLLIQDKLNRISTITYKTIKIIGVRKALATELEVHIGDVTYNGLDRLNATDIDILKQTLQTNLNTITGFLYNKIDVVSDKFYEEPTANYKYKSMTKVK